MVVPLSYLTCHDMALLCAWTTLRLTYDFLSPRNTQEIAALS